MASPREMLAHLRWLATIDANYARWRAQQLVNSDPHSMRRLPAALDEHLVADGIELKPIWDGSDEEQRRRVDRMPPAVDRRSFIERLHDELPDCFPPRMRSRSAE